MRLPPAIPCPRRDVENSEDRGRGDLAQPLGHLRGCIDFSGNILTKGQEKDNGAGGHVGDSSQHILEGHVAQVDETPAGPPISCKSRRA